MKKSFNLIGAGHVGQVLGRLFVAQQYDCQSVMTRELMHATQAVEWIGAGTPTDKIDKLLPADIILIAVPDDQITHIAQALATTSLNENTIVCHTSGFHTSALLDAIPNVQKASVHPVKSFAEIKSAYEHFSGTFCSLEGEQQATETLKKCFDDIGAQCFELDATQKALYHTALVYALNFPVVLMETAINLLKQTQLSRGQIMQMILPQLQQCIHNVATLPEYEALTGPIARGDAHTVIEQFEQASNHLPEPVTNIYRTLATQACHMMQEYSPEKSQQLLEILRVLENV